MRKSLIVILFLAFSVSIISCQKNNRENTNSEEVSKSAKEFSTGNNTAPDFVLTSTEGKKVQLSDYRGKIVILDFWATWCPPCRKGIPDLIEIQKEYKDKVVVIGVSLDIQTKDDVVPFIKEYGINYPVVYGNQEVVVNYGNIRAIPTTFIINEKGKIAEKHIGLVPKSTYVKKIKELSS